MKITLFSIPDLKLGKHNLKDCRLDKLDQAVKAKSKTYAQVELVGKDAILESEAIIVLSQARCDLILEDLEFVETRLSRCQEEQEKELLNKIKSALESEKFISQAGLSREEKTKISGYDIVTDKPVIVIESNELGDLNALLLKAVKQSGYISFFTSVGGKETRAWLLKHDSNAWEAAGLIHSDIQKGFIRAEVTGFNDFLESGGLTQAKQAGKMRLEQKDYVVQDADIINFRFNK